MLCTAAVNYKKATGTLNLSKSLFQFVPDSGSTAALSIDSSRLQSLFSSKEGSAKVQLKIGILPASSTAPAPTQIEEFFSFTFIQASSAAFDQQIFKAQISAVVAINRERREKALNAGADKGKGKEKELANGSNNGTATPPISTSQSIFQLRRKVLIDDASLASLHSELVRTNLISEEEFWEGRETLLAAARAEERQQSGKSGEMVDPRPETAANGEVTVRITPSLVREIFEEYPSVLRAYGENVPKPLDEQQFWSRYFQSKLFNRNRTTNRAVVETIRDDAIFDLYLDEEDDELEPKNLQVEHIYKLLDLAATEEDQHEIMNRADPTMQAGRQRSSLPLMRRFNEHSERLLNSSLGHSAKRQRMALDPGNAGVRNAYYDDIILEDLNTTSTQDRIILETRDRATMVSASTTIVEEGEEEPVLDEAEMVEIIFDTKSEFNIWSPSLGSFIGDHTAISDSMKEMTNNIRAKAARADRESNANVFPESFLQQMLTVQSSSNEFLRQFWFAVLPARPVEPGSTTVVLTVQQKAAKAERMKGYLTKMEDKVSILFQQAEEKGIDLVRVEAALDPVRTAVAHAIAFFNARTA